MNNFVVVVAALSLAALVSLAALAPSIANASESHTRAHFDRGSSAWRNHVHACLRAFSNYDPRTDTYMTDDGNHHRCDV